MHTRCKTSIRHEYLTHGQLGPGERQTGNLSFWVFGPAKPHENQELPDRSRTILFDELLDHFLEVWIPYAKAPREPVSAALGNFFASRYYVELASLARRTDSFNV